MALLNDLIVTGVSRLIGITYAENIQANQINALTTAGGSSYGMGSDGQVLKSDGTNIYWASLGGAEEYSVTDRTSATAIETSTRLVTERTVYYGLPTINNDHTYTSSTTLYAPTTGGTANYVLWANGVTSAPTWKAPKDATNYLINSLDTGTTPLTANDYIITQYVGGGSTTTTYYRRAASNVRVGGLTTARYIQTNLAASTSASFDGTANILPGVTGTLAIANGGTGATTAGGARTALGLGTMATEAATSYIAKSVLSGAYDIMYSSAANTPTRLAANTTATKKFLRMTGTGSAGAAPAWDTVTKSDVGLGSVENTALSTWAGSSNITTIGTLSSGTVPWARLSGVPSSMTPSSHTHGNLSNDGKITTTATIANGDKLVIIDTDSTAGSKITGSSITFDGSTTSKALTPKGTWETFNNYSHPSGTSAALGFYKIKVDTAMHVTQTSAVTKADLTGLGVTEVQFVNWNSV